MDFVDHLQGDQSLYGPCQQVTSPGPVQSVDDYINPQSAGSVLSLASESTVPFVSYPSGPIQEEYQPFPQSEVPKFIALLTEGDSSEKNDCANDSGYADMSTGSTLNGDFASFTSLRDVINPRQLAPAVQSVSPKPCSSTCQDDNQIPIPSFNVYEGFTPCNDVEDLDLVDETLKGHLSESQMPVKYSIKQEPSPPSCSYSSGTPAVVPASVPAAATPPPVRGGKRKREEDAVPCEPAPALRGSEDQEVSKCLWF